MIETVEIVHNHFVSSFVSPNHFYAYIVIFFHVSIAFSFRPIAVNFMTKCQLIYWQTETFNEISGMFGDAQYAITQFVG